MRLPGRIAAAMEVLAEIQTRHRPAAEALRDWGLSHRFAGSGDRAAIGNLVYDALRHRASIAWRMDANTPRALALGAAVLHGDTNAAGLNALFAGDRHAPDSLSERELERLTGTEPADAPDWVKADIPEWTASLFEETFGAAWPEEARALAERPPLDLRVNRLKAEPDKVARQLARLGVTRTTYAPDGLRIAASTGNRRHPNIASEEAFRRGRIEMQDEGSQIAALLVGATAADQVLDFCAGAGGKTLALADAMHNKGQIYAHDADRNRLAAIYERIKRASVRNIQVRPPGVDALVGLEGHMDRVLVDAPCSGSGVWRRRPDAKWRLSAAALDRRTGEQARALAEAAVFVKPGGVLVYVTCSLLARENSVAAAAFLAGHDDFASCDMSVVWRDAFGDRIAPPRHCRADHIILSPASTATDGFFIATLKRNG
ncbi:MAG TPA: RsmB/NOP family class I SAM-dependent RNA methyltransferase [Afifellaceae bacterium]|nr:RsmB/NOP family class I SAM-dependent RNA methyltransferase [Afifellaceae bacterium]